VGGGWLSSVVGTGSQTVGQGQKRNSKKVFNIISELRPKGSSTKVKKNKRRKKDEEETSCHPKLPNYISLYNENP
jgi:hypothetical protein